MPTCADSATTGVEFVVASATPSSRLIAPGPSVAEVDVLLSRDTEDVRDALVLQATHDQARDATLRLSARHHISRPSFAGTASIVIGAVRGVDNDCVCVHELEQTVAEQLSTVARVFDA